MEYFKTLLMGILASSAPVAIAEEPSALMKQPDGAAVVNPVAMENALPGDSDWRLTWVTYPWELSGYASTDSAQSGDAVAMHVHSQIATSATYTVYRMGWYGGLGGRKLSEGQFTVAPQPSCPVDSTTGLIECAWSPSFSFIIEPNWLSGVYLVKISRLNGPQTWTIFNVRDNRTADVLAQSSVTTWQAYNNYGGESLYHDSLGLPDSHAVKVSFNRPYEERGGQFFRYEVAMVQWLESQGYDVTYVTNLDFIRDPRTPLRVRLFLSIGHDEYWSAEERNALEAARDAGVSQGYFSANTAYWQIRVDPGSTGPLRTITCYKSRRDPLGDTPLATVQWRQPPVLRPENGLLGVMYQAGQAVNTTLTVVNPEHWLFEDTGLGAGDTVGLVVGYESDRTFDNGATPEGTLVLAEQPVLDVFGKPSLHQMSIYRASSGAWILGTGSINWDWGIAAPGLADRRIQIITENFFSATGAAPATPSSPFPTHNVWDNADFTGAALSVATIAGAPGQHGSADGPVASATFDRPSGIALVSDGTIYVADTASHRIRKIQSGIVSTLAGSVAGNADGTGTDAQFMHPNGLALGPDGNLYVADSANNCVRKVTPAGVVTRFAGHCEDDGGGYVNGDLNLSRFRYPQAIAVASDGTIYVADCYNNAIRGIRGGQVTTLAGSPGYESVFLFPNGISIGPDNNLYVVDAGHRQISRVTQTGAITVLIRQHEETLPDRQGGGFADGPVADALAMPSHGIVATSDAIYISDSGNHRVRRISLSSMAVTTYAGTGRSVCEDGAGSIAATSFPLGLALQGGFLYVSDSCGAIRTISIP